MITLEQITEIKNRHAPHNYWAFSTEAYCSYCDEPWPCSFAILIQYIDQLKEEHAKEISYMETVIDDYRFGEPD